MNDLKIASDEQSVEDRLQCRTMGKEYCMDFIEGFIKYNYLYINPSDSYFTRTSTEEYSEKILNSIITKTAAIDVDIWYQSHQFSPSVSPLPTYSLSTYLSIIFVSLIAHYILTIYRYIRSAREEIEDDQENVVYVKHTNVEINKLITNKPDRQNIHNIDNKQNSDHFNNQQSVNRKLAQFVNAWNIDLEQTEKCFYVNGINDLYFKNNKRSHFIKLLKHECDIKAAVSTKLWIYFGGGPDSKLQSNDEGDIKTSWSEENIDDEDIWRDQQILRSQDQYKIYQQKLKIESLEKEMRDLLHDYQQQIESDHQLITSLDAVIRAFDEKEYDEDDDKDDNDDGVEYGELLSVPWNDDDEDDAAVRCQINDRLYFHHYFVYLVYDNIMEIFFVLYVLNVWIIGWTFFYVFYLFVLFHQNGT